MLATTTSNFLEHQMVGPQRHEKGEGGETRPGKEN